VQQLPIGCTAYTGSVWIPLQLEARSIMRESCADERFTADQLGRSVTR